MIEITYSFIKREIEPNNCNEVSLDQNDIKVIQLMHITATVSIK